VAKEKEWSRAHITTDVAEWFMNLWITEMGTPKIRIGVHTV
jgi:hypothetical protein